MKQLLLNKLFEGQPAKQYLTISAFEDDIGEKVFFKNKGQWVDVTKRQFVVCQNPFVVGIWFEKSISIPSGRACLKITDAKSIDLVKIDMEQIDMIALPKGAMLFFSLRRSSYPFIPFIHRKLLIFYFYWQRHSKVTLKELEGFCATYLYPRKVILTCFGKSGDYNLFPMDLQGFIAEEGIFVLGLRNTNVTLKKILLSKKVVVCDVDAKEKERLYMLGAHHSSQPPKQSDLPFDFEITDVFLTPIPDIITSYKELEIIQSINMGSHTVIIGKVVNEKEKDKRVPSLYHLHITYAIKKDIQYAIV